jgi:hypothetical protein
MQSVTKTITSVVIGVATARKEFPTLETPVLKYVDASAIRNLDDRKRRMTRSIGTAVTTIRESFIGRQRKRPLVQTARPTAHGLHVSTAPTGQGESG